MREHSPGPQGLESGGKAKKRQREGKVNRHILFSLSGKRRQQNDDNPMTELNTDIYMNT